MPFRFVHTADIHLDSPLRTLALRDPELAGLIGGATRRAFVAIVDLCLAEQVDALVVAGDLYDGEQTSMKTARFLADQLRRLHEADVRTFIIRGNHDAESRITNELTLPDSVTTFRGRADAVAFACGGLDVAIHGVSFAQRHAPESLLPKFKPPRAGALNVGLMHTSLGGSPAHDRYAPCAPADLHASGFDYWALGHIHERFEERGKAAIVMPGNPQGRDINEAGPKSATLATARDDRTLTIEPRLTSVAEFCRVAVDCAGVEDWRAAAARMTAALEAARADAPSEHLVARLTLRGATPFAWTLRADADRVAEEARLAASGIGGTWIDKVEIRCDDPAAADVSDRSDPVAELRALMEGEIGRSTGFMDALHGLADELRAQLPADVREDLFGRDAEAFASALSEIAADGVGDTLARLAAGQAEARP